MVSQKYRQSLFQPDSQEVYIMLTTISHESLAEPIRVTSDNVTTLSRGDTYVPFGFELTLPNDVHGSPPRAKITFPNVDPLIVKTLRSIEGRPKVKIEEVLYSDTSVVEQTLDYFELGDVEGSQVDISAVLSFNPFLDEPYPKDRFDSGKFPGGF